MAPDTLSQMLHKTSLFETLDDDALMVMAGLVEVVEYQPQQYLFHERQPRQSVMIVESGEVTVTHGIGQRPVTLATL
ncbi:MAG: cyclic nucleotide-binding domain-containing protein, partial [Chloroflexota bacterium]